MSFPFSSVYPAGFISSFGFQTRCRTILPLLLMLCGALPAAPTIAQGTLADYERADRLQREARDLFFDTIGGLEWIGESSRFWYRKQSREGKVFLLVDAARARRTPAFDHARLAAALNRETGSSFTAGDLPFDRIGFQGERTLTFEHDGRRWSCDTRDYTLRSTPIPERAPRAARTGAEGERAVVAPDSTREAFIRDHDLWVRDRADGSETRLSFDGSPGAYHTRPAWSPDSRRLVTLFERPGYERLVHYVESSPDDQVQPKHSTRVYAKPGDVLDQRRPVLFDVAMGSCLIVDDSLFRDQYDLSRLAWREDSRNFTFEFNARGHQTYRVLEVAADTREVRAFIEETSPTFIHYSGKRFRYDLDDGREIVWASERDGWNHLYLYDGITGRVKRQITRGAWPVRSVLHVDPETRQIVFEASGMDPAIDPYLRDVYQVGIDGGEPIRLTAGTGDHRTIWSEDRAWFVDTWSLVDQAPESVLRRASDGRTVLELEQGDITDLLTAGIPLPEPFVAKGRDGTTDIWGVIWRPSNFDADRSWPVIEYIYAGPHDSFVPKTFRPFGQTQALAELGFVVVQIDGMGTSNRSKAFHDVCWRNLGDAGFPDRILWHRAVAQRYPWYDIDRGVGIYGHSAGGQNSLGGLLFHPDFYTVAVSSCGCHDNRMDKIWWNEQWMGYPIGPWYEASSNVVNAHRLEGKLFLIVGEMDTNVDPASTLQVVDALVEADKDFDLLVLPGVGHAIGGDYGERRRRDFFVRHLLGVEPPDWNRAAPPQR